MTCAGNNYFGQLGAGTSRNSSTPLTVKLPASRKATAITAGVDHACALLDNGTAVCWDENGWGQLGNGTFTNATSPVVVKLPTGRTALQIATAQFTTCARSATIRSFVGVRARTAVLAAAPRRHPRKPAWL